MQKKYQVFISSTFRDLMEERQDTLKSVLDMGHIPSGMEIFPAADVEQFEYIKKIIDECDYYVLIVASRYGSVDGAGVSFTEKEYHYAVSQKKTVLAFIHNDLGNIPTNKTDMDERLQQKLAAFRKEIAKSRLVQLWTTREELRAKVIISLHKAISEFPAVGWMRASAAASEDLLAQINELRVENAELRADVMAPLEGMEQLADVEEVFRINYNYKIFYPARSEWKDYVAALDISWKDLFVIVAPQLTGPRSGLVRPALEKVLKEKRLIAPEKKLVEFFETDINAIELQLQAYGLIASEVAGNVSGGVNRFIQLTPLGSRRYLEWGAVKARE